MELRTLTRVLARRRALRRHEGWTPTELAQHQARALAALREHASRLSPFYRRFHRGLDAAPLQELPVLTKGMLMHEFDDVVVDRDVRLADVLTHVERGTDSLFRGRYVTAATSGSTGRRGVFLFVSPSVTVGTNCTGITGAQGPTRWRADGSSPWPRAAA